MEEYKELIRKSSHEFGTTFYQAKHDALEYLDIEHVVFLRTMDAAKKDRKTWVKVS